MNHAVRVGLLGGMLGVAALVALGTRTPAHAQATTKALSVNGSAPAAVRDYSILVGAGGARVNVEAAGGCTIMTSSASDALVLLAQLENDKTVKVTCTDGQKSLLAVVHYPVQAAENFMILTNP